jgi:hypothetical protein
MKYECDKCETMGKVSYCINEFCRDYDKGINTSESERREFEKIREEQSPLDLDKVKERGPLRGWVCPVCGSGNSPYSTKCNCGPHHHNSKLTFGNGTTVKLGTSSADKLVVATREHARAKLFTEIFTNAGKMEGLPTEDKAIWR